MPMFQDHMMQLENILGMLLIQALVLTQTAMLMIVLLYQSQPFNLVEDLLQMFQQEAHIIVVELVFQVHTVL